MRGNLGQILQNIGRDASLPGVELAIELLQELRADLLGGGVNYVEAEVVQPKRLGRPPGSKGAKPGKPGPWGNLTPEERSAEMRRRMAVAKANRGKEARKTGARTRWQKMTKAERAEWQRKMQQGAKRAARKPKANGGSVRALLDEGAAA